MSYRIGQGWPGGSVGRATLGPLAGSSPGSGIDGGAPRISIAYGTCEGVRADGRAYVLLDGASGVLALPVAAELPLLLLVGRRVVVAGDDAATWLVVGITGSSVLNVANGLLQLDGSGLVDDDLLSANVALLDQAQTWTAKQGFAAGLDGGLTTSADIRATNVYIPRQSNIAGIVMLDHQDELALLTRETGRTASLSTAPSSGLIGTLFQDDSNFVAYNAGTSPFPLVLEMDCSANVIPSRASALFRMALTFRSTGTAGNPTTYLLEQWDNTAAAYVTVSSGTITITDAITLLPQFQALAASGSNIYKLRLTLDGTNPIPVANVLRLQRVILYHGTHTWDPWHLHRLLGGVVYGDVGIGALGSTPNSRLQVGGPIAVAYAHKTANYTITANDSIISCDASGGARTITLPTAANITGRTYTIKRTNSGANSVTVDGAGAETIDGAATYVLTTQWQSVTVVSDGVGWLVV